MCRLLGWLGAPADLDWLLYQQPQSLHRQSWAPLEQRHGTINADGWGVGWHQPDLRPEPARYRTTKPMWTDASFRSIAGLVRSGSVLAAVRSATPPSPIDEVNTPPFTSGPWLFAHNGAVPGWTHGVGELARRQVSERRASAIEGSTDSEVLFALALDALDDGAQPVEALRAVIDGVGTGRDARLTMLLTDGQRIAGAAWGDTLGWIRCAEPKGIMVASEPPLPRSELDAVDVELDRTITEHDEASGQVTVGVWRDLTDGDFMTWDRHLLGEPSAGGST